MLSWFKSDPKKKLEKEYAAKLEAATAAQRNGKIPLYAQLMDESEQIAKRLDAMS